MSRKIQNKTMINDWIIYHAITSNGWSIVILPENILIDNYPLGYPHIHPDPQNHEIKLQIKEQNSEKIKELIFDYLRFAKKFDVEELIEMIKWLLH